MVFFSFLVNTNLPNQSNSRRMQQSSSRQHTQSSYQFWRENRKISIEELKEKILKLDHNDFDSKKLIEQLLCGAAKQLQDQKNNPDTGLILTLIYLCKMRPLYFRFTIVVNAFSSLLRRENLIHFKLNKINVPAAIINIFQHAFEHEKSWPEIFIKLFIEDFLGDRVWVDSDECQVFVKIMAATFHTKISPNVSSFDQTRRQGENQPSSSFNLSEEVSTENNQPITSRYSEIEQKIIKDIYEIIQYINTRQSFKNAKNFIQLLELTAGITCFRQFAVRKIEDWFKNSNLSLTTLLYAIFNNSKIDDMPMLYSLFKINNYSSTRTSSFRKRLLLSFKEFFKQNADDFDNFMDILLKNEISPSHHNSFNLNLISIMFEQSRNKANTFLVKFYLSTMFDYDERALRSLLRDILKLDLTILDNFVECLLKESENRINNEMDFIIRKKICNKIVDFLTMAILYFIQNHLENFCDIQMKIVSIQDKLINWIYDIDFLKSQSNEYIVQLLKKSLFLEATYEYCKTDNWPPEYNRQAIFEFFENIPLSGNIITKILKLKVNDMQFSKDACKIIFDLLCRVTKKFDLKSKYPILLLNNNNTEIVDLLIESSRYICSNTSKLPSNYTIPNLAQISVYWEVWIILTIIAACIPFLGQYCWEKFPTCRALIEMAIMNNFQYPPNYIDTNELHRLNEKEKMIISQFERYLKQNNNIDETNSLLIHSLIEFNPGELTRYIREDILNKYKKFCKDFNFCTLLCQNKNPNYLLLIKEKQPKSENEYEMFPWLVKLIESCEHNYGILPVECLCDYFLKQIGNELCLGVRKFVPDQVTKKKRAKLLRLILFFKNQIQSNDLTALRYFLFNLDNPCISTRACAYKAMEIVFFLDVNPLIQELEKNSLKELEEICLVPLYSEKRADWFIKKIMEYFKNNENDINQICKVLNNALLNEMNPILVCEYLELIGDYYNFKQTPDECFAFHCASLLLKRKRFVENVARNGFQNKLFSSINKIFLQYIEILIIAMDTSTLKPIAGSRIFIEFNGQTKKLISIHEFIMHSIIYSFLFTNPNDNEYRKKLHLLFSVKPYPICYQDFETGIKIKLIPKYLILFLLTSNYAEYLDETFLLNNSKWNDLNDVLNNNTISPAVETKIRNLFLNENQINTEMNDDEMKKIKVNNNKKLLFEVRI